MIYSADRVWAAAVDAFQINDNKYIKYSYYDDSLGRHVMANRQIMTATMNEAMAQDPKPDLVEQGRKIRDHFRGYLLKMITNSASDFQRNLHEISNLEEVPQAKFGIIAYAVEQFRRDQEQQELDEKVRASRPLKADVGSRVSGQVKVLKSFWSMNYGIFFVTAQFGDSVVAFSSKKDLQIGEEFQIQGRVKSNDKDIVKLNYVKVVTK